jgi:hypothetical protein
MRRDALVKIESKDMEYLKDPYNLYKIRIYKKSDSEQICFTTPEAAEAIKLYVSKRPGAKYFHNVSNKAITAALTKLAANAGIVQRGVDRGTAHRNEVPAVHGLRKFAATQMGRSDMKVEAREIVLGHSIGVRAAYQKYTDEDLLREYLKAVDLLTINEANRLRKKVDALEEKEDRISDLERQLGETIQNQDNTQQKLDRLLHYLQKGYNSKGFAGNVDHEVEKILMENLCGDIDEPTDETLTTKTGPSFQPRKEAKKRLSD